MHDPARARSRAFTRARVCTRLGALARAKLEKQTKKLGFFESKVASAAPKIEEMETKYVGYAETLDQTMNPKALKEEFNENAKYITSLQGMIASVKP